MQIRKTNRLSVNQLDNLIKNKNTINLAGLKTSKERYFRRKLNRQVNKLPKIAMILMIFGILFTLIWFFWTKASDTIQNDFETQIEAVLEENNIDEFIELVSEEYNEPVKLSTEEYLEKQDETYTKEYIEERKQEWWKENTIKIIKKYEWLHLTAYCDKLEYIWDSYYKVCHKYPNARYSIWYGSLSFKWETITEEKANNRLNDYLENNVFNLIENNSCYTANQKTAIADFIYNSWQYTKHSITKIYFIDYVRNCNMTAIEWFLAPYNYRSAWLKKRRQAQYNFWKEIPKI